jgi:hypothetical protein
MLGFSLELNGPTKPWALIQSITAVRTRERALLKTENFNFV